MKPGTLRLGECALERGDSRVHRDTRRARRRGNHIRRGRRIREEAKEIGPDRGGIGESGLGQGFLAGIAIVIAGGELVAQRRERRVKLAEERVLTGYPRIGAAIGGG